MFTFSDKSKAVLKTVHTDLQIVANYALSISIVDFGIPSTGGLRTAEEQQKLFLAGKSKADGYQDRSNHQSGRALDVFAFVGGKASWDEYHLALVATAMLQSASKFKIALEWGGLWQNFKDFPHFQLATNPSGTVDLPNLLRV